MDHRPAGRADCWEELRALVLSPEYPCLAARSVFVRGRATLCHLPRLGAAESTEPLLAGLREFGRAADPEDGFASFVAVFDEPAAADETEFERLLWLQLALVRDADPDPWSAAVSADPGSPHFGFSAAGTAYFVVGMHPGASRLARRAPRPTLVFNSHAQFEQLRATGRYERMQKVIRRRDTDLQGCPNPMLADFGTASEALQYSGRRVEDDWAPPSDGPW